MAILGSRGEFNFSAALESDCAPLNGLVADALAASANIHCLRDPTRGGLATTLNELAAQSQVGIIVEEGSIPVLPTVLRACEMLGFDPLYVANEGKMVVVVDSSDADGVLSAMRRNRYGRRSAIIGKVVTDHPGRVAMRTRLGSKRIVDQLVGNCFPGFAEPVSVAFPEYRTGRLSPELWIDYLGICGMANMDSTGPSQTSACWCLP